VIPSTVLSGGVRLIFTYANYLSGKGHDVMVYVPKLFAWEDLNDGKINWKTSIANTFKRGKQVSWFPCDFPIALATKICDKYIRDADVTVASAWYTARNVAHLSESKGRKAYFIQDYEVWGDGSDQNRVEATYCLGMDNITIAQWLDEIVFQCSGKHTTIILNGVDDEEIFQGRKKINKNKTIIMLGNMAARKGAMNGITILKELQQKYGLRVILYAASPSNAIPDSFEFYCQPKREKLMQLYTEADICLFPSVREGWGLIVTEAMAHQCAVVGNNTGALSEIGINGENAMIASDFDPKTLRDCLERVLNDETLLKRLQLGGLQTAMGLRNSKQFTKFEEHLRSLIGEK
jgi:hypothetical protein